MEFGNTGHDTYKCIANTHGDVCGIPPYSHLWMSLALNTVVACTPFQAHSVLLCYTIRYEFPSPMTIICCLGVAHVTIVGCLWLYATLGHMICEISGP